MFFILDWWNDGIYLLLLLYRVNYRQGEELFKIEGGVTTRTVGYKLAMKRTQAQN